MARLVIFGAGDIAKLAHHYFTTDSEHEVVAFTVDAAYRQADTFCGLPLVDFETLPERYGPETHQLFVALSYAKMNQVREAKYHAGKALGYTLASYVSSRATYLAPEPPGDNCFLLEDVTVQPFVTIGSNVTMWSGSHIAHDSTIADHVFIAPKVAISGHCHIRSNVFIGVNATVRNAVTVAPHTLIGAGAVIVKDTRERGVYLPHRAQLADKTSDQFEL